MVTDWRAFKYSARATFLTVDKERLEQVKRVTSNVIDAVRSYCRVLPASL